MNDEMDNDFWEGIAKAAYHEYGGVTDWKNYQGLPMPPWKALTPTIQSAWIASVKYVAKRFTKTESFDPISTTAEPPPAYIYTGLPPTIMYDEEK